MLFIAAGCRSSRHSSPVARHPVDPHVGISRALVTYVNGSFEAGPLQPRDLGPLLLALDQRGERVAARSLIGTVTRWPRSEGLFAAVYQQGSAIGSPSVVETVQIGNYLLHHQAVTGDQSCFPTVRSVAPVLQSRLVDTPSADLAANLYGYLFFSRLAKSTGEYGWGKCALTLRKRVLAGLTADTSGDELLCLTAYAAVGQDDRAREYARALDPPVVSLALSDAVSSRSLLLNALVQKYTSNKTQQSARFASSLASNQQYPVTSSLYLLSLQVDGLAFLSPPAGVTPLIGLLNVHSPVRFRLPAAASLYPTRTPVITPVVAPSSASPLRLPSCAKVKLQAQALDVLGRSIHYQWSVSGDEMFRLYYDYTATPTLVTPATYGHTVTITVRATTDSGDSAECSFTVSVYDPFTRPTIMISERSTSSIRGVVYGMNGELHQVRAFIITDITYPQDGPVDVDPNGSFSAPAYFTTWSGIDNYWWLELYDRHGRCVARTPEKCWSF